MYKDRKKTQTPKGKCYYCETKTLPSYKDVQVLGKFLSPRSRILPRSKTGTCAKHQRLLGRAIKVARHLALIPFVVSQKA